MKSNRCKLTHEAIKISKGMTERVPRSSHKLTFGSNSKITENTERKHIASWLSSKINCVNIRIREKKLRARKKNEIKTRQMAPKVPYVRMER